MANERHTEGLQYEQEVAYNGVQTKPANFYMGLATDASPAEDASIADLTELASGTYARVAVPSNAGNMVSAATGTNDRKITSASVNFANSSGGDWTPVNIWFLATTVDDSGKLLASGPLPGAPVTVGDGSDINVSAVLQNNG